MSSDIDIEITPQILLNAYCSGVFPMAESRDDKKGLMWFSPENRALIPIEDFHVSSSLRKKIRKFEYKITFDKDFNSVIKNCANIRKETWINNEIINLYNQLHKLGFAHSVEVWNNDMELIGGLYGISIGGAFFGESMFSKVSNASKIALVYLVARLKIADFDLLDAQFDNKHLHQFGMYEVPKEEYLEILHGAIVRDVGFFDNYSSSVVVEELEEKISIEVSASSLGLSSSINSSSEEVLSLLQSITQTS